MANEVPVLYELDGISQDSEATGIVHWFCSNKCMAEFKAEAPVAIGMDGNYSSQTKCETCQSFIS